MKKYYLLCLKNALMAWKIIKAKRYFVCGIFNGLNGEGRGKGHFSTLAWRKIKRSIKSATYASTWCYQVCSRCTHMAGKLETFFILYKIYSPAAYKAKLRVRLCFRKVISTLRKKWQRTDSRYIWRTISQRVINEFLTTNVESVSIIKFGKNFIHAME